MKVHRLIYLIHKGDIPEKYDINHINGNKLDNRIENLEACTRRENNIHAVTLRTIPRRKLLTSPKFCGNDINAIYQHFDNGLSIIEISKLFNVHYSTISRIIKRITYSNIENLKNNWPMEPERNVPVTKIEDIVGEHCERERRYLQKIYDGVLRLGDNYVYRSDTKNFIGFIVRDGYHMISIKIDGKDTSMFTHRLMYYTFKGAIPENMCVHHKDNNKANFSINNLELATPTENKLHNVALGKNKSGKGENNSCAKFKNDDIIAIKSLIRDGMTRSQIAKLFNTRPQNISRIATGKRWSSIVI